MTLGGAHLAQGALFVVSTPTQPGDDDCQKQIGAGIPITSGGGAGEAVWVASSGNWDVHPSSTFIYLVVSNIFILIPTWENDPT